MGGASRFHCGWGMWEGNSQDFIVVQGIVVIHSGGLSRTFLLMGLADSLWGGATGFHWVGHSGRPSRISYWEGHSRNS